MSVSGRLLHLGRARGATLALALVCCGLFVTSGAPHAQGTALVVTSQLGYVPGDPMSAVLMVPTGTVVNRSFRVLDTNGTLVVTSAADAAVLFPGGWAGNDSVGDTYRLDFTGAALPAGEYRVESNGSISAPFRVAADVYDVTRLRPLEFFRIQLSGVPSSWSALDGTVGGHGPDHLDDGRQATRKDRGGGDRALIQQDYLALPGGWLDVSGGWSDAGDYNKYMGNTPWAAYLLLLTLEEHGGYWAGVDDDHNGQPDLRDVVRPALDWMLKMQHTDGSIFERVFNGYGAAFDGRPDLETDNRPGTSDDRPLDTDRYADITVKAAYAWAAGYRVFGDARYLTAARAAWDWAFANQTRVKPKVYGGGLYFGDIEIGLTLGALELHRAEGAAGLTPHPKYLQYASARVRSHLDAGDWTNPSSWDYQQSYALIRYFALANDTDQGRILAQLRGRWDWAIGNQNANAYRMNDEWLYGDFGQNENSTSSAGDALWLFERTGDRRYYDYAVNQMSWVFGRNPFGESWLASARVSEYTRVPHWRATAKRAVEGVVVPGATDRNGNGRPDYTDTGEWFYSEPTVNQQAMFLRVMTALFVASGGVVEPPSNAPPAIAILSPSAGATLSGTVVVSASVTDAGGVLSVSYAVDGGAASPMTLSAPPNTWTAPLDTTALSDGLHQIAVLAVDNEYLLSTAAVTVGVQNGSQPSLHVDRVTAVLVKKGGGSRVQARGDIFIYDAFGAPVAGAVVTGHWTGAATDTFSVTTDASGKATDYSDSRAAPSGSVFTCVVDSVSKAGWLYDAGANSQTSGSVTVP